MPTGNTKYGSGALQKNIIGSNNSAFGTLASRDTDASWNTSVGAYANMSNTVGISNVALGTNSLLLNVVGSYNTGLGTATLLNNTGNGNTAIGSNAMQNNLSGDCNVAIGIQTGYNNNTGQLNVFLGTYAGFENVHGSKNTFLGTDTGILDPDNIYNNSTAIGYGSIIDASNQIMMGTDEENVIIPGNAYLTNILPDYTEQSIVSKKYVDTYVSGGLKITTPCNCATTTDINLTQYDAQIDGVDLTEGMRVLVRCQGSTDNNKSIPNIDNGIYIYHYNSVIDASFSRAVDCSGNDVKGQATFILDGNENKSFIFSQTEYDEVTNEAIAGIDLLQYDEFYKISFSIGNGLQITGNTLQVKPNLTDTQENPFLTDVTITGKFKVEEDASFNSNVDILGTLTAGAFAITDINVNTAKIVDLSVGTGGIDCSGNSFFDKPITMSSTQSNERTIYTGYMNLADTASTNPQDSGTRLYHDVSSSYWDNQANNGNLQIKMKNAGGSQNTPVKITYDLVEVNENLKVAGDASFNSNIDIYENLNVINGDVSLNNKLRVGSDASFNSSVDIYGNLKVNNGDVSLNNKLRVGSDASFNSNVDIYGNLKVNNGEVSLNNKLRVAGDASFNSNVDIFGNLKVNNGDVSLNNKLMVGSDASFNSNVDIYGNLKVNNGEVSLNNKLRVAGDASFNSNVDIYGNLNVNNGNVSLNNKLRVGGDASFNSNVGIAGTLTVQTIAITNANVSGATTFSGTANFSNQINMNSTIVADRKINTGYLNLSNVTESSELDTTRLYRSEGHSFWDNTKNNGDLQIKMKNSGGLQKTSMKIAYDVIECNSDISLNGKLNVGDDVLLNSKLKVIGDTILNSNVDISGTLTSKGYVTVDDSLSILGYGYLSNVASESTSLVNKTYVDGLVSIGVKPVQPCLCASTGFVNLAYYLGQIDGIDISNNDRVLISNQNGTIADAFNGIYVYHYNSPSDASFSRASDCNETDDVAGQLTFIQKGLTNGKKVFVQNTHPAIVGIDSLIYIEFYSFDYDFSLGYGLKLSSGILSVDSSLNKTTYIGAQGGNESGTYWLDSGSKNIKVNSVVVGKGGTNSTIVGDSTGTTGNDNTFVGYESGKLNPGGNYNTFIGSGTCSSNSNIQYSTAIGYGSTADASNQIMLGTSLQTVKIPGNAKITYGLTTETINVINDASLNSKVDISGNLKVNSDASFNSKVDISGNLKVNSDASFNSKVDISGNLKVNSDASFNSKVDISGNLKVNSDVSLNNKLRVSGDASFNSNVDVSGNIFQTSGDPLRNSIQQNIISNDTLTNPNNFKHSIFSYNIGETFSLNPILTLKESSGKSILFFMNLDSSSYNPISQLGDRCILSYPENNSALSMTTWSTLKNGIRISATSSASAKTELWGGSNSLILDSGSGITTSADLFINSVRVGRGVGNFDSNTVVGPSAGDSMITGTNGHNVFFGNRSGQYTTIGSYNSFVGSESGYFNNIGNSNTFVGYRSGRNNTSSENTFLGSESGYYNNTGHSNTFVGYRSGLNNTTGFQNTFVGYQSGRNNSTGVQNLFVGTESGLNNNANYNTFLGYWSGKENSTGSNNIFIGASSGKFNTGGSNNTFIGTYSGQSNTTGTYNTFLGYESGTLNTTGLGNTHIGFRSGRDNNNNQNYNTFLGFNSGYSQLNGSYNTCLGYSADVTSSTVVSYSTAIGYNAKVETSNTIVLGTATETTKIPGKLTLLNDATINSMRVGLGNNNQTNTIVGNLSGNSLVPVSGSLSGNNTFIGHRSGQYTTTGYQNTFVGALSGYSNVTGYNNTYIGNSSGQLNTSGSENIFIGQSSGLRNIDGCYNVYVGYETATCNTKSYNTFVGHLSGRNNTIGTQNTYLGCQSGLNDISGSYNTYLGYQADVTSNTLTVSKSTAIGHGAKVDTSNTIVLGTATETTRIPGKFRVAGDASFNSNVDISGILKVNNDVSLNSKLRVAGDASFNSNVDISGNLYMTGNNFIQFSTSKTTNSFNNINSLGGYIQLNSFSLVEKSFTGTSLYPSTTYPDDPVRWGPINLSTVGFVTNATYLMTGKYFIRNRLTSPQSFYYAGFYLSDVEITAFPLGDPLKYKITMGYQTVQNGNFDTIENTFSFLINSSTDFSANMMYGYFLIKPVNTSTWGFALNDIYVTRLG